MKKSTVGIGVVVGLGLLIGISKVRGGAKPDESAKVQTVSATKGDLTVSVVETGTIDALRSVEVKPQVSGRLKVLKVLEGDHVNQGDLIAIIDPQETQFKVQQETANLHGAQSAVEKATIQIAQRRALVKAAYDQALVRTQQLKLEAETQPELSRAALQTAETNLTTALEQRRQLLESTHPTSITAAASAVREAEANYDNAKQDHERQQNLLKKGYVAARAAESAELTLQLAKVRLDQSKDNLAKLDSQIRAEKAKADESVKQAQAALSTAKANLIQIRTKRQDYESSLADLAKAKASLTDPDISEREKEQSQATVSQVSAVLSDANRQLRETEVRAPISGIVTKKLLEVGELATGLSTFSAGTAIVKIEDRRNMRVKLDVNEIDVAKMSVGMDARVTVDALPTEAFRGKITRIAPASKDSGSTTTSSDAVVKYEVEIKLTDARPVLRSGMSAKCTLDVIRRVGVTLLPVEYVSKESGSAYVEMAAAKGAKPEKRKVKVGAESGSMIEILGGLKPGDVVQLPTYNGPKRKGAMQFGNEE